MYPHARRFVSQGHPEGADYEVLAFKLGRTNRDESRLELEVRTRGEAELESLAAKLIGATDVQ